MDSVPHPIPDLRELGWDERALLKRMLELAGDAGVAYMAQLDQAYVIARCPCGCPSIDLGVRGFEPASGPMRAVIDLVFEDSGGISGISLFEQGGILGTLELCAMSGGTPMELPPPDKLLTYENPKAAELMSLHMLQEEE